MKAAATAAVRGHSVTLVEKARCLGGQMLLNRSIPGREEMVTAALDLEQNLRALNVEIHLNSEADRGMVRELAPDAVIVATGARPVVPDLTGTESSAVVQAWDLLDGTASAGPTVIIIGGNAVGLETALFLANQGTLAPDVLHFLMVNRAESVETLLELLNRGNKQITVVEMAKRAGKDIGASTRWTVMAELRRLGVNLLTATRAVAIIPGGLEVEREDGHEQLAADSIVLAAGSRPANRLTRDLSDLGVELHTVGDAHQPRNALSAIRDGFTLGLRI